MNEKLLNKELEKIKSAIKYNAFPYIFIVSNDINIRNYFAKNISDLEGISTINNIKITHKELKKKLENNNGILYYNMEDTNIENEDDNSLYYALVTRREILWEEKKTIITICDEKTSISLLSTNASLSTASWFYFIDDIIKDKENPKKLIKQKVLSLGREKLEKENV